jgi:hypothetical protein
MGMGVPLTRHEHGHTCPLGFTGRKRQHIWIETTVHHRSQRRFACDSCTAVATESRAKIGGDA